MIEAKNDIGLYPVRDFLEISCRLLGVSVLAIVDETKLGKERSRVTAEKYFEVWSALERQYNHPDFAFRVGIGFARGGFVPSLMAFSSSANIINGMERLAEFKPLMGPITVKTELKKNTFSISIMCNIENLAIPPSLATCELVLFLELFRLQTGRKIVPLEIALPIPPDDAVFFGTLGKQGSHPRLVLSIDDATTPLLNKDRGIFSAIKPELNRRLDSKAISGPAVEQCRIALRESIPNGRYSLDEIASKLHLSKRSLQRLLRHEGASFQKVLDQSRAELALYYLKNSQLSLQEIAFILGYASTPSFSRAFKKQSGMTPNNFRRNLGR